jgi:hypothetical protein
MPQIFHRLTEAGLLSRSQKRIRVGRRPVSEKRVDYRGAAPFPQQHPHVLDDDSFKSNHVSRVMFWGRLRQEKHIVASGRSVQPPGLGQITLDPGLSQVLAEKGWQIVGNGPIALGRFPPPPSGHPLILLIS